MGFPKDPGSSKRRTQGERLTLELRHLAQEIAANEAWGQKKKHRGYDIDHVYRKL